MVCTTQQTRNKSYTKNTKTTNMKIHNKGIMIHTRMFKKTITISTINRQILQKKKILQTDNHQYTSNFWNSKSDKRYEQWVIILWKTFSENCDIYRDFYVFIWWFTFLLWFVTYCLSYAIFLFVLKLSWLFVVLLVFFMCLVRNSFDDFDTFCSVYWYEHKNNSAQIHIISVNFIIMCSIQTNCAEIMMNVIDMKSYYSEKTMSIKNILYNQRWINNYRKHHNAIKYNQ